MARPWFSQKSYGFGFVPSSWEGLLATAVYLVAVVAAIRFLPPELADRRVGVVLALAVVALLTGGFLWISGRTMQGDLRWRHRRGLTAAGA